MKINYFFLSIILLTGFTSWQVTAQTQVTVTGTTTPASGTQYGTLSAAFSAIGTSQIGKDIVITLSGSTTEQIYGAVLGAGTWNSLKIYPTVSGVVVSNVVSSSPLITLNGADNVTIDGRVNQTGPADMIINKFSLDGVGIIYQNTAGVGYTVVPTVTLSAPPSGVTATAHAVLNSGNLSYVVDDPGYGYGTTPPTVTLTGGTYTTAATARASTAITSTIDFEKNAEGNTIQYCILEGNANATKGIVYFGSGVTPSNTYGNGNNIIQNNLFTSNINGRPYYCVYSPGTGAFPNVGNKIRNNEFKNFMNQGLSSIGIYVSGSAAPAPNNSWTITGNSFYEENLVPTLGGTTFSAIQIGTSGSLGGTGYTVSNNYIGGSAKECGGVAWTKSNTFDNTFNGISLYLTAGAPASSIQNNTIKNFSWSNSANAAWTALDIRSGDINIGTITGNTIGDNSTGSINYVAGTGTGKVYGININIVGTVVCQNNTIGSITAGNNTSTGVTDITGIYKSSGAGNITISNNTIGSTSNSSSINATTNGANTVSGINCGGSGTNIINGNTVANLVNSTNVAGSIWALRVSAGTNAVNGNFMYGLSTPNSTAATAANLNGIFISGSTGTYSNNIISLGDNNPNYINGISESGTAGQNNNIYFNTVQISGNPTSGTLKSICLYDGANTNTRDYRNNIFSNSRSTTGGSNVHYPIYILASGGTITCDNNDYFKSGTGGTLGYYGGNITTLPIVSGVTGNDANSKIDDPYFANAVGTKAVDFITSLAATALTGVIGTGITTDYAGATRYSAPKMGAYESSFISSAVNANGLGLTASSSLTVLNGGHLTIHDPATLNNITILNGAHLTINGTTILNNISIEGGGKVANTSSLTVSNFTIKSDETNGTGTYNDYTGTTTINGSIAVKQSLTGAGGTTPTGRFWYLSSPVTGATSSAFNAQRTNKLWYYTELTHGYTEITDNTTLLASGKGYTARLGVDTTVTFTGTGLYTGDKTFSLTRNDGNEKSGYNLIGNPYPSFLDWQAVTLPASVMPTIWTRSCSSEGAMGFDTYNSATLEGVSSIGNTNVTQYIAPMQAFWVKVASGNPTGSFTVTNAMRYLEDQTAGTNRLKAPSLAHSAQQVLRLQVSNGTNSDEAIIAFNSNASNDFDKYDSPKMSNDNAAIPEIYTVIGSEKVAINGLEKVKADQQVPLVFTTGESNAFSIKATRAINFDTDTRIMLKDNLLNAEQDLTDGAAYNFTSDAATVTNRFSILFKSASVTTRIYDAMNDKQAILIYKNANNLIAVNLIDANVHEGMISVCNAMGQKLVHIPTIGSSTVINKCFKPGVYFVTVTVGGRNATTKIIIN